MVAPLAQQLAGLRTHVAPIGDLHPRWSERLARTGVGRRRISHIEIGSREYGVGDRFMQSLVARFHIGREFFRYFTPDEVFTRVQEVHPQSRVRLTTDGELALGISNPDRPIVQPGELCRLLEGQHDRLVHASYAGGIVRSIHRVEEGDWKIGADLFSNTCTFETPVDGFGLPSVYLSLIRLICTNGMIGYAPAFRTEIPLGRRITDGAAGPLGRAMDCFSNEEGYAALRQRLESARQSEASMYEVRMLCRVILRDTHPRARESMAGVYGRLWQLTGDIAAKYGVAGEEAISRKKQSMLPMDCTVYELVTFATELATHHADKLVSGRPIHAWVGQTLAAEYDLEGSLRRGEPDETPAFYLH
jgi:hypothetical protein